MDHLKIEGPAKLVRIYIGEADQWHHQILANAIVERARKEGLAEARIAAGLSVPGSARIEVEPSKGSSDVVSFPS